ncbi:MAG: hypothetical protein J5548_09155 [Prevotella sp.]|jgi:ADP-ribose pyrophosphatase YjhB (NUDIX family)|nr:hypothetical protein [Prevotella sp.]
MKKKVVIFGLLALMFAACHQETMEERTLRECQEITRKRCPEDQGNNSFLDSMVFDVKSHTIIHYYRLVKEADNEENAMAKKAELDERMVEAIRQDMSYRSVKDAGYSFRFIARSDSSGRVLYDKTITKDDYGY